MLHSVSPTTARFIVDDFKVIKTTRTQYFTFEIEALKLASYSHVNCKVVYKFLSKVTSVVRVSTEELGIAGNSSANNSDSGNSTQGQ